MNAERLMMSVYVFCPSRKMTILILNHDDEKGGTGRKEQIAV